ncbi:hypothetical protein SAMN05216522_101274 [Rosenbergiella nectarea]|uniref:Membrane-bound lysozyme-inhibitor of c-type lysozyme n=1 Tax=Rosenbergiella nectarea TaxID=988801 RepID=A0A1H9DIH8_9GAMM|nr:hypothetical protein [Rosenbergiella nectarea]SEQ12573.1 hypothetical protein SAMN05216522_101274 [Rosenbergiella nectarea]
MQYLKGCLLLALLYNANSFAETVNVLLRCENGVHAMMKDHKLSVEGMFNLPFEHVESNTSEQTTLVFADAHVEAKILLRHADTKFFLQDSDGRWIHCKANRITP